MRAIGLAAVIASMAIPVSAAPAIKSFEMFGLNSRDTYSGEIMVGGKKCKLKGTGKETCSRFYGALIGTVPILYLTSAFNNGHFVLISGTTPNSSFSDLAAAFAAKYGPATSSEDTQWQNQMGATFPNNVKTWVFDDGKLELRQRGSDRDTAEFTYINTDALPTPPDQPVNF